MQGFRISSINLRARGQYLSFCQKSRWETSERLDYCKNLWKETYLWKNRLGSSLCWHVNHFQNKPSVSWTQGREVLLCWSSGCNNSVGCLSSQIYRLCLSYRLLIMSNACKCVPRCVDVRNLIWPSVQSHWLALKSIQINSVLKIFHHGHCNCNR